MALVEIKQVNIPAAKALALEDVMEIYHAMGLVEKTRKRGVCKPNLHLVDILDEFEGLVLDGYGVINIGNGPIAGIKNLLDVAAYKGKPVVVLTNGASFSPDKAWAKYHGWGLPIPRADLISSRDALISKLSDKRDYTLLDGVTVGCFGRTVDPLIGDNVMVYDQHEKFWQQAEEFVFLGALDWQEKDQKLFEKAMINNPRPLHVANPDVSAPQAEGEFSKEPGFWTARMMQVAANSGVPLDIRWYGKPFGPAFELAITKIKQKLGQEIDHRRIAMVGDSLHTDILGGAAAGMTTVLITDHGLFREREALPFCRKYGIYPDWIVKTL